MSNEITSQKIQVKKIFNTDWLPAVEFKRVRESAKIMKREKRRRLRESGLGV